MMSEKIQNSSTIASDVIPLKMNVLLSGKNWWVISLIASWEATPPRIAAMLWSRESSNLQNS